MVAQIRTNEHAPVQSRMPASGRKTAQAASHSSNLTVPTNSVLEGELEPIKAAHALLGGKSAKMASASAISDAVLGVFNRGAEIEIGAGMAKLHALLELFQSNSQSEVTDALSLKPWKDVKDKAADYNYQCMSQARQVFETFMLYGSKEIEDKLTGRGWGAIIKTCRDLRQDKQKALTYNRMVITAVDEVRTAIGAAPASKVTSAQMEAAEKKVIERMSAEEQMRAQALEEAKTSEGMAARLAKQLVRSAEKEDMTDDFLLEIAKHMHRAVKDAIKARDLAVASKDKEQAAA